MFSKRTFFKWLINTWKPVSIHKAYSYAEFPFKYQTLYVLLDVFYAFCYLSILY